jgi:hypothetical protein
VELLLLNVVVVWGGEAVVEVVVVVDMSCNEKIIIIVIITITINRYTMWPYEASVYSPFWSGVEHAARTSVLEHYFC